MNSTSILRQPLRSAIRRYLLDSLMEGRLQPGSKINESELAQVLGVSRTPLREALLHLEFEGFIESAHGRGFRVAPLRAKTAMDLHWLVGALEGMAARPLAELDPDTLRQRLGEMREVNQELNQESARGEAGNADRLIELGDRWHALLTSACDNAELIELLKLIKARLYRYTHHFVTGPTRIECTVDQHNNIIAALERRDFDAAVGLIRDHWMTGADRNYEWLREEEAADTGSDATKTTVDSRS
jgi:DNA-binding GntR family transcriptional regulator